MQRVLFLILLSVFYLPCFVFGSKGDWNFNELIFGQTSGSLKGYDCSGNNLDELVEEIENLKFDENYTNDFMPKDYVPSKPIPIRGAEKIRLGLEFCKKEFDCLLEEYRKERKERESFKVTLKKICFEWVQFLENSFFSQEKEEEKQFELLQDTILLDKIVLIKKRCSFNDVLDFMEKLSKGLAFLLYLSHDLEKKFRIRAALKIHLKQIVVCQLWAQETICLLGKIIDHLKLIGAKSEEWKEIKKGYKIIQKKLFACRWWAGEKCPKEDVLRNDLLELPYYHIHLNDFISKRYV